MTQKEYLNLYHKWCKSKTKSKDILDKITMGVFEAMVILDRLATEYKLNRLSPINQLHIYSSERVTKLRCYRLNIYEFYISLYDDFDCEWKDYIFNIKYLDVSERTQLIKEYIQHELEDIDSDEKEAEGEINSAREKIEKCKKDREYYMSLMENL